MGNRGIALIKLVIIIIAIILLTFGIVLGIRYIQRKNSEEFYIEDFEDEDIDELEDFEAELIDDFENSILQNSEIKLDDTYEEWVYEEESNAIDAQGDSDVPFYVHALPVINIDSNDAKVANTEIKNLFKVKNREDNYADFRYDYYVNGNILSLVITDENPTKSLMNEYKVYNFDLNTGKKIGVDEILAYKEITMKELYEYVTSAFRDTSNHEEIVVSPDLEEELVEKSVDAFILEKNKMVYLDDQEEIHVITKTYFTDGDYVGNCDLDTQYYTIEDEEYEVGE